MCLNCEFGVRASEPALSPWSLDLAPALEMVNVPDGDSQGKAAFPSQSCIFRRLKQRERGCDSSGRNESIFRVLSEAYRNIYLLLFLVLLQVPSPTASWCGHSSGVTGVAGLTCSNTHTEHSTEGAAPSGKQENQIQGSVPPPAHDLGQVTSPLWPQLPCLSAPGTQQSSDSSTWEGKVMPKRG